MSCCITLDEADMKIDKEWSSDDFWDKYGAWLHRHDMALNATVRQPRPWFFTCISPFLFFMPIVYMNEIDKLYVDPSIRSRFWPHLSPPAA